MALSAIVLSVGEDATADMDFTSELASGVTITAIVSITSIKVDGTASELTHSAGAIDGTGKIVQHSVSDIVTNDITYIVLAVVTLSTGKTKVGSALLMIRYPASPKVAT